MYRRGGEISYVPLLGILARRPWTREGRFIWGKVPFFPFTVHAFVQTFPRFLQGEWLSTSNS